MPAARLRLSPTEKTASITTWTPSTAVLPTRARRSAMLSRPDQQ